MLDVYRKLHTILLPHERRRLYQLFALILALSLIEVAGIGSVLPFLAVVSQPEIIETNEWLSAIYGFLGFGSPTSFLIAAGVAMFVIILITFVTRVATTYAITRYTQMRTYSIGTRVTEGYLAQPYDWFLSRHGAGLSHTVLNEVGQVVNGALLPAIKLIANVIVATLIFALLLFVEPVVTLAAVGFVAIAYSVIYLSVRRLLLSIGEKRRLANRARFHAIQEASGGIKEVKVMGLEAAMTDRFRKPARELVRYATMSMIIQTIPRLALQALLFGGIILMVIQLLITRPGGLQGIIPVLGLFAFAGMRLMPAIQGIYSIVAQLRTTTPALDALFDDIQTFRHEGEPGTAGGLTSEEMWRPKDQVELRSVVYAYPGSSRPALAGVDIEIPARSSVGIVGGTGAGKTTTVDILLGLLTPQEGALVVDGEEVTAERRRLWRHSVGYVPQHIFLSDASIAENIAFGVPRDRIDHAAVEKAARVAELHRYVAGELPDGYATKVGERGVRLSGGQRQRVGIARALYRDPDVLILDEATAALDNLTERAVMESVGNLGGDKTVVMIAHRLSTVRRCDRIYLMEQGRIAAHGSYDELLSESDAFRRMVEGAA